VGLWREHVLPRLVDRAMSAPHVRAERERWLAGVHGRILEIGFGSGLNLPHYTPAVTQVLAVEPSALAVRLARRRIEASPIPVAIVGLDGENLPFDDASLDAVVSTWTLCTIPHAGGALAEIRRVLRPGGRFHFIEHGRSPDPAVSRWQDRLTPLQKRLAGGCHLNRRIDELIRAADLSIERLETFYLKGPRVVSYHYAGVATRPEVSQHLDPEHSEEPAQVLPSEGLTRG
jgi:SAM-dependent methyltransferase